MSNAEQIDVRITADSSQVGPGMNRAADEVQNNTARIREHFSRLNADVSAHMTKVKDSVRAANDDIVGSVEGMAGKFKGAFGVMAAAMAVLAGGKVFKDAVEESKAFTGEANKLARALGISTTEASALNVALGDVYSSADDMIGASQMLSRQLRTNEESLKAMGLQTRDASGEYRNMNDLMMDAIKVLNGYKEGTDRNLAAQTLFGRGAGDVNALLKLNAEVVEAAKQKQAELGLIVGAENVAALKAYKAAMNDAGDVVTAVKKAVGDALMPVLSKLGEWFSSIGPAAVLIIKGAIGGLVSMFWVLKTVVTAVWETINAMVVSVAEPVRGLVEALYHAAQGDFEAAAGAIKGIPGIVAAAWTKADKEIQASAEESANRIWELFATPTATPSKEVEGKGYVNPKDKPGRDKQDPGRMPLWEAELEKAKEAYMLQHDLRDMAKEDELAYWSAIASRQDLTEKESIAVTKKTAQLRVALLKEEFQHRQQLSQEAIDAYKSARLDEVEADKLAAEFALQTHQVTDLQKLALDREFSQREYDIQREALQQRLALLEQDPNLNPAERQRLLDQIAQIERKHQLDLQKIQNQQSAKKNEPTMNVFKSWEDSFSQASTSILTRAKTLQGALRDISRQMYTAFVNEYISKRLAAVAMNAVRESAFYKMLFADQATSQAAASTAVVTTKTAEATAVVGANAAEAASGAAASVSSIPFVGWAMAAGVFAATLAMVMGAKGNIKSARTGYDIPAGVNPVTQLHEEEMVLPKEQADAVRRMAAGGDGGGSFSPVINVRAMDARDVVRALSRDGRITKALAVAHRNFSKI